MEKKDFKILIVDDSDFSRHTMKDILKDEGYSIVGDANDFERASKMADAYSPDLYIIDVVMPEHTGFDLIGQLKIQGKINSHTEIIMLSSLKSESLFMEVIAKGASDFLQKPFSPQELVFSVANIYKRFVAASK